jgi:hypothetical protein
MTPLQTDLFAGAENTLTLPVKTDIPAPHAFFRQARAREYAANARGWLRRARLAKRNGESALDIEHYVDACRRCWRNARRYERGFAANG